jgi:hypothetical protein
VRIVRGSTVAFEACCIAHDGPLHPDDVHAIVQRTLAATGAAAHPP